MFVKSSIAGIRTASSLIDSTRCRRRCPIVPSVPKTLYPALIKGCDHDRRVKYEVLGQTGHWDSALDEGKRPTIALPLSAVRFAV